MPISCCTARNRRKKRVRGNPPEPSTASRVLKTRLVGIVYLNDMPKEHILNSFGCLFFMLTVCVAWFIVCVCFGFASAARKNRMLFLLKFSSTFSKRSRRDCKGRAAPYDLSSSPFLFSLRHFRKKMTEGAGGMSGADCFMGVETA